MMDGGWCTVPDRIPGRSVRRLLSSYCHITFLSHFPSPSDCYFYLAFTVSVEMTSLFIARAA